MRTGGKNQKDEIRIGMVHFKQTKKTVAEIEEPQGHKINDIAGRLLTRNQFTAVPVVHELQLPNEYGLRTIWISVYCTEYGAMYIAGRRSALVVTPDSHNRLIFPLRPGRIGGFIRFFPPSRLSGPV